MTVKDLKTKRYTFRVTKNTLERMRMISLALHTPLPDLIQVAVLSMFKTCTSPVDYVKVKTELLLSETDRPGQGEPPTSA